MAKRQFNVEMQSRREDFFPERALFYWCRAYGGDAESGDEYKDLPQTYSINVVDFNIFDCARYHTSFSVWEDEERIRFTDRLSIHVLELRKVPKSVITGDNQQMWMKLIKARSEKELEMVRKTTKNPMIQKGVEAVLKLNADPDLREQIRLREDALRDYNSSMSSERARGLKEGLQKGIKKGSTAKEKEMVDKLRKSGVSEDVLRSVLGDDYKKYAVA